MVSVEQYKQYRQELVKMHAKILDDFIHRDEFLQGARILGILDTRQKAIIQSEMEQDALCDFNIYEEIRAGQSTLARFAESYSPESQLETELLAAMLHAEASLYEIIHVDKQEHTITLHDILSGSDKTVKFFDLNLSNNINGKFLIYTRLLHLEAFSMTSGLGFLFAVDHKDYLLNRRRKILKKLSVGVPSVDNFIAYFHLNRSDGIATRFEDVK